MTSYQQRNHINAASYDVVAVITILRFWPAMWSELMGLRTHTDVSINNLPHQAIGVIGQVRRFLPTLSREANCSHIPQELAEGEAT